MSRKLLILLTGPTAVGKTKMAVSLAQHLDTEIINADSRQVYKEMIIGTAVPSISEQAGIKHHFLAHRSIHEVYNASRYEQEVITFLEQWFLRHDKIIMVGGSGLYIDAVLKGIDDFPDIDPLVRLKIRTFYSREGLEGIRSKLKEIDRPYYEKVDLNNPQRILKALEVTEMTGKAYSSYLTGRNKERNFETLKFALDMSRTDLHERINVRVEAMIAQGLISEARQLYPFKHLNALNTVGYKELFEAIEGNISFDEAVVKIKNHTRQYARRQLTWFRRDKSFQWLHPSDIQSIICKI